MLDGQGLGIPVPTNSSDNATRLEKPFSKWAMNLPTD